MLFKCLEPDFSFSDERGQLVQLVHNGYEQVNVLTGRKGSSRGGHYHKVSQEAFYLITGKIELILKKDNKQERMTFVQGDFFAIEPFVIHSMNFLEESILIALYDHPIEDTEGEKDIYAEELLE